MNLNFNDDKKQVSTQDRYLTLKEVREMFNVSRSTIWRWQADRGLRVVSIGGVSRIRESDLNNFLGKHDCGAERRKPFVTGCDLN